MTHLAATPMTLVKRDPFARTELMRQREYDATATCQWCGSFKETPKTRRRFLFRFWSISDGGRSNKFSSVFCSNGCFYSYYK